MANITEAVLREAYCHNCSDDCKSPANIPGLICISVLGALAILYFVFAGGALSERHRIIRDLKKIAQLKEEAKGKAWKRFERNYM